MPSIHIAHDVLPPIDVQMRHQPHAQVVVQAPSPAGCDEALIVFAHVTIVQSEIEKHPSAIAFQMDLVPTYAARSVMDSDDRLTSPDRSDMAMVQ